MDVPLSDHGVRRTRASNRAPWKLPMTEKTVIVNVDPFGKENLGWMHGFASRLISFNIVLRNFCRLGNFLIDNFSHAS